MITPDKALKTILDNIPILDHEVISYRRSLGRILAEDIKARNDAPCFDNSEMDGFAVKAQDLAGASKSSPRVLKIQGIVKAGDAPGLEVNDHETLKIMTGAQLPKGANAVVMKEMSDEIGGGVVRIFQEPKRGEFIRKRGSDVRHGEVIIRANTRIRSYEIAFLASQGIHKVSVYRKPKVALIVTGDELLEESESLKPGKIRNSNGPSLVSILERWGAIPLNRGFVRDDVRLLESEIKKSLRSSDAVLVSGGVSVGDYDYTKSLLEKIGVKVILWKVAAKPGKPLLFGIYEPKAHQHLGSVRTNKPVFGLPGNPVSVLVSFEEFVLPALEKMQGYVLGVPAYSLAGEAENNFKTPKDRQQFLFCEARKDNGKFILKIIDPQGSAMSGRVCRANALAKAPIGPGIVKSGESLPFRWLK
ncbi:gephyrin-like molybdotransferase Glp [Elusimicrobiota bacterium]